MFPFPTVLRSTAYAYRYFIKESGLEEKMRAILSELTDVENSALLRSVSSRLRDAIMGGKNAAGSAGRYWRCLC